MKPRPHPNHPKTSFCASLALLASLAVVIVAPLQALASDYATGRPGGVGKIEEGMGGYVRRDGAGRRLGTIDPGPSGTLIERDNRGRRIGAWEPGFGGEWVVRDNRGRRVGTVERRP